MYSICVKLLLNVLHSYPVGLDIIFYQYLHLLPYCKFARSDGSGEIAHLVPIDGSPTRYLLNMARIQDIY